MTDEYVPVEGLDYLPLDAYRIPWAEVVRLRGHMRVPHAVSFDARERLGSACSVVFTRWSGPGFEWATAYCPHLGLWWVAPVRDAELIGEGMDAARSD